MRSFSWKQWPLALKLTATITTIVILVVMVVTLLGIRRERQNFQAELESQAVLLLNTISANVADSLYFFNVDFLADFMLDLGESGVVTFGRIYDTDGRIVADAVDVDGRFTVDPDPFGQQLLASDAPIFEWHNEELLAGQAVIIGRETIGAISIGLPTTQLTQKINQVRNQGIAVAVVAVGIGLVLALLFSRSITEPIQEMIEATARVSQGDLSQRVTIHSGDELATLGQHFNEMTHALRNALRRMEEEIEGHKKTEAELQIAKDAAESANRAKSTFLANMSHELRTPLSAILGYSELMLEQLREGDDQDFDQHLKRINTSGKHLLGVISDILDLSKIEAGRMQLQLDEVDVKTLVQEVATTAEPLIIKNSNKFKISLDHDLGLIYTDEAKMRQVLLNLLSNASKFTHNGTISLTATRQHLPEGADWLQFAVQDTGIGISPENLSLLFKPFVQVDSSTTRRYEGTGLGLAVSQSFCHMMGGKVTVESEVDKGSTFTVHLPVKMEETAVLTP